MLRFRVIDRVLLLWDLFVRCSISIYSLRACYVHFTMPLRVIYDVATCYLRPHYVLIYDAATAILRCHYGEFTGFYDGGLLEVGWM